MKRALWSLAVAIVAVFVLSIAFFQPGDAQDTTGARLSSLETTVAGQSTAIASLTKRVKALEPSKAIGAKTATPANDSSAANGKTTFKGTGQDVKTIHLTAGVYKMTAHSASGFFYIVVVDKAGTIINYALTMNDPQTDGSVAVTIPTDGDYVFQVNATDTWTVAIGPA